MSFTILITGPQLTAQAVSIAERRGARLVPCDRYASPETLAEMAAAETIDGIIVRQGKIIDPVIAASPRLKVIAKHGVGYDNIDIEAASRRGIPVYIARGANSQSVAEMAFALMFGVARDLAHLDARMKSGHWDKATHTGTQLLGRSLGIVGLGEIGRTLMALVQPLRMRVAVFDPYLAAGADVADAKVCSTLDELLETSDVVSLHCPLTPQTRNLIGSAQLARMRPGSFLINTARGGLVDEAALFAALRDGRIGGAGLDTFAQEPVDPKNPLLTLPNVIATPHAGASTQAARDAMGVIALTCVLDVLDGKAVDLRALVNARQLQVA